MSTEQVPPSVVEVLSQTHEGLEVWWDSSPLIYRKWCEEMLAKEPDPEKRAQLEIQLRRLYDESRPAECLFDGVTTNPPLSKQAIDQAREEWDSWVEDLVRQHPEASLHELFWRTYTEVVKRGAAMFRPKFERSGYRRGYLSGQVDPRLLQDLDTMLKQAQALNGASPNIMIKMPGTQEGIEGIRILTSLGIPTNATLVFTVSQLVAVAEAVMAGLAEARAKGVDLSQWRSVGTMMLGRFEGAEEFQRQAAAQGIELTETDLRWAGLAVFKKAYRIFQERGYETKLLAASMRLGPTVDGRLRIWHIEKLAGGNVVLTIFPNVYETLFANYTPEEIVPRIDEPVPEEELDKLLQIEYFRQGYEEGAIPPEKFIEHPAVIATGGSFAAATRELEEYVRERMAAVRGT